MSGYVYKGTNSKPAKRRYAPKGLPNDPTLKREHPPVRPPYGNALRRYGCGTTAGVSWHKRRGESACAACREARAAERRGSSGFECGTLRAYRWHVRSGTTPCPPCQAAFDEYKAAACGTMSGVRLHHKAHEPVCEPCKAARRAHRRGKAKA